ncbi:MAG: hypothetical protein FJ247_08845 [Nitrospira sp.]|nr:hypothetical protein [Nitrospira sp.]
MNSTSTHTASQQHSPLLQKFTLTLTPKPFRPKLSSRKLPDGRMMSSPLEDLSPFLSREELKQNMLYPLQEE